MMTILKKLYQEEQKNTKMIFELQDVNKENQLKHLRENENEALPEYHDEFDFWEDIPNREHLIGYCA